MPLNATGPSISSLLSLRPLVFHIGSLQTPPDSASQTKQPKGRQASPDTAFAQRNPPAASYPSKCIMFPSSPLKNSICESLDSDNLNRNTQYVGYGSTNPPGSNAKRSAYSGYAYVPPLYGPPQLINAEDTASDDDSGLIQAANFPLPPTLSGSGSRNPYRYHTFPPPTPLSVSPSPFTPANNNPPFLTGNHNHDSRRNNQGEPEPEPELESPCYFDTLDFSDYHPNPPRPSDKSSHPHETAGVNINTTRKTATHNLTRQPLLPHLSDSAREYRPRARPSPGPWGGRGMYDDAIATGGALDADPDTALGLKAAETAQRRLRREAVAVVCVVVLVFGLLAAAGWAVATVVGGMGDAGWGQGKFIDGQDGVGDWELCSAARPRFCRLVVGG